ncbi:TetR/AcrR family transcriptional regulator [Lichenihabitans sp. Uapishka_5]|uniref:TetR/AcrR family transcriptional regulator n=1 Tax=Lichenihabitans sp. Uapishka_5 TaxID=3037302 RepID=UPI0029E81A1B|nr:TetR/AcrR family transcriptional regulator [Lichenihabitans sp. Uapishka_5]MDX7952601.1 TetR/AcrR family transcriptional regulator [Lichenihabitans sp. Uapishka_5]
MATQPGPKTRNPQDGRERLIESARAIFRSKVRREVSRLDIARHAGVAPGLVTYHFNSNAQLVLAVTRPVLGQAIAELFAALDAPLTVEERLNISAILFIDFAQLNGALLDLFVEAVTETGDEEGQALIHACIERLEQFFAEMVAARFVSADIDPVLLLMAMWGMCRLVGETPPLPLKNVRPNAGIEERTVAEARFITKLILQGVKPKAA